MHSSFYDSESTRAYYRVALDLVTRLRPSSVLDVGGRQSPVLSSLPPSISRTCLDIERLPRLDPGIRFVHADFTTWTPDQTYDLVLCLEVLPHVEDPAAFAQKLFTVGRTVLLSIPYRLPRGMSPGRHSSLDETTLATWTGRRPTGVQLVRDGFDRLLAVYIPSTGTPQ
jgi:hypothetical protein